MNIRNLFTNLAVTSEIIWNERSWLHKIEEVSDEILTITDSRDEIKFVVSFRISTCFPLSPSAWTVPIAHFNI